jgi:hypothetical protein
MPDFAGCATPLGPDGVFTFCHRTGANAADLWAVLAVETSGFGFLPDKRPKILFERHIFHDLTYGRFDASHPDISHQSAGGYGMPGAHQYMRLTEAAALDRPCALQSASWGIGQILGLNHRQAGFPDIGRMVGAMAESEDDQVAAMAQFLCATGLDAALRCQDWARFAQGYNGPDYAASNYDGLLAHFHARYTGTKALPDLTVRQVQADLTYRSLIDPGCNPRGVDGIAGPATRAAILRFQVIAGLAPTGDITEELLRALVQAPTRYGAPARPLRHAAVC